MNVLGVAPQDLTRSENKSDERNKFSVIPCEPTGVGRIIFSVFHTIISLVAIYLTFRCNEKFNIGSFLMALLFPYIYIIYILATKGTCGIISTENKV